MPRNDFFYDGFTEERLNDFIEWSNLVNNFMNGVNTEEDRAKAEEYRKSFYLEIESVKINDIESAIKETEESGDSEKKTLLERVKEEVRNARKEMYKRKAPNVVKNLFNLDNREFQPHGDYNYWNEAETEDLICVEQEIDKIKINKDNFQNIAYRTNTNLIDYTIEELKREVITELKKEEIEKNKEQEIKEAIETVEQEAEEMFGASEKEKGYVRKHIDNERKIVKERIINEAVEEYIKNTDEETINKEIEESIKAAKESGDIEKAEKLENKKEKIEKLQNITNKAEKLRKSATIYGYRYQETIENDSYKVERKPDETLLSILDKMFEEIGKEMGAPYGVTNYIYAYLTNASDKTDLLKRLNIVDEKLDKYEEVLKEAYGKGTYKDVMEDAITTAQKDFEGGDILGLDEEVESR